jgi:hypothetical protein
MKRRSKAKKAAAKKTTRKRKTYNPQTGQLTGREVGAQVRLEQLAEEYIAEGMTPENARNRAREVMRDNPKRDWRRG